VDWAMTFAPSEPAAKGHLGPLERQVLEAVWKRGSATVRELVREGKLWQTYPTIMTTMNRLFRKGLFDRATEGRAFRYSCRYSLEEIDRAATLQGVRQLLGSQNASLHLSFLVQAVSAQDSRLLDELQELVERHRASSKTGEQK